VRQRNVKRTRTVTASADYGNLSYTCAAPSSGVVAGMHRYLQRFDLLFGAFDFAVTDTGWVVLECNPSGEWLWLAEATGLPIAAAVADLLVHGPRP
jgi:hypothetical protein